MTALVATALGALAGSADGAVAGTGLVAPGVRLAVIVALGAGAGLAAAFTE